MDEGFLEDSGESSKGRTRWIPGPIEVGLLGGTRKFGKPRLEVTAFRCRSCGVLEMVAHELGKLGPPAGAGGQGRVAPPPPDESPVVTPSAWPEDGGAWPNS